MPEKKLSLNTRAYNKLKTNFKPIINGNNYHIINRLLRKNWKRNNNGFYVVEISNKNLQKLINVAQRRSLKLGLNVIHYRKLAEYFHNVSMNNNNNNNFNMRPSTPKRRRL